MIDFYSVNTFELNPERSTTFFKLFRDAFEI